MKFIQTVTGLHGQPLHNRNLQVGSWVQTGKNGKATAKGVLMGTIMGKPVVVEDFGESRDIFRERMRSTRKLVKLANQLFDRAVFVN